MCNLLADCIIYLFSGNSVGVQRLASRYATDIGCRFVGIPPAFWH